VKDKTEIMPSFNRWIWLLKRTAHRNNWSHLHERFLTDESYLRELANMMDYVNDESNNVLPNHKVRASILHNKNPLYEFRQNFAVARYKRQIANQKDVELVQEMIKRTIWAKEYDEELMTLVAESFDRRKSEDKVDSLDSVFQLKKLNIGKSEPEYKTPYNIKRIVAMMLDEDMSMSACIEEIDREANNHSLKTLDNRGLWRSAHELQRPSIWDLNRWQSEMAKYKYTALNDYLLDRMERVGNQLNESKRHRIKRNWKIDIPEELFTYQDNINLSIGKVTASPFGNTPT
jgi:hypothetical protein